MCRYTNKKLLSNKSVIFFFLFNFSPSFHLYIHKISNPNRIYICLLSCGETIFLFFVKSVVINISFSLTLQHAVRLLINSVWFSVKKSVNLKMVKMDVISFWFAFFLSFLIMTLRTHDLMCAYFSTLIGFDETRGI